MVLHYFVAHKFLFWAFRYPLAEAMIKIIINLVKNTFRSPNTFLRLFRHQLADWARGAKNLRETQPFAFNLWCMKHVVSHISSNRRQDTTANSLACQIWTNQFPNNPERNRRQYIRTVRGQNILLLYVLFLSLIGFWYTRHGRVQHTNCPWITKTSVTVMFSKAPLNFLKDRSKSDYAYSQLELKICIRSQWSQTVTDDAE